MEIKIKVKGMHCNGCEMNVQDSVYEIEGVKKVKADFKKELVAVSYDEKKTGVEAIKKAITEAGYIPE